MNRIIRELSELTALGLAIPYAVGVCFGKLAFIVAPTQEQTDKNQNSEADK